MLKARLRLKATADVEDAISYYVVEADSQVALRFVDELERATRRLELHPELGSLRFAFELDLPGVRSFRVDGFPYLIFYMVRSDHLDVLRVLHSSRDIPTTLRDL